MSHRFKALLAVAVIALGASLLTTTAHADDDDWEDYTEAWEDYYKSLRRQNRHYQPRGYSHPGHIGYGAAPYHPHHRFYTSQYDQPWHYGYGVPPHYGYAVPHYGGSYYGGSYYGQGRGSYWRPRSGFYLRTR